MKELRTHSDGYIKGDKYFFFRKVDAVDVLLKLNYLSSSVDTIQKDHIFYNKQYQAFYRKIKRDIKF